MLAWGLLAAAPSPAAEADDVRAFAPFWAQRVTGYLTAADGVLLRYSALLPAGGGRHPVILNYSGYDAGSIGGTAYRRDDTAMSTSLDRTLVERGYVVMGVNARGTGCSGGTFDFLGPRYGEDGRDAVEFAAAQPWSSGAVGMANWSWAGMAQLATAAERPRHLRAIAPGMVLGDPRLDSWAPGGVPAPAFISGWRAYLHSRWEAARQSAEDEHDARCLERIDANLRGEAERSITREVFRHPLRDAWIESRRLTRRTARIRVPVLSMESFQDEAVTSREGYYQQTLDPRLVWMVQTNGGHDLYESLAFRATLVAFLDRFVKGEPNGFERRPRLDVWMDTRSDGSGVHGSVEGARPGWEILRDRIAPPVRAIAYALTDGRRLVADGMPSGAPDEYAYPVPGPSVDADPQRDDWGPQPAAWRAGSVAYTSAPLERVLVVHGPASADLWLSSSSAEADVQVTLTELRPDGQEVFIQRGWLRLSNRAVDAARSTAVRPVLVDTPAAIRPLEPGEPVLARVELNKFAYAFRPGSRLRLWIDTPSVWGGYGFAYYPLPATHRVWHDVRHASRLVLGELAGVAVPDGVAPCGAALKEPCRADPLAARR